MSMPDQVVARDHGGTENGRARRRFLPELRRAGRGATAGDTGCSPPRGNRPDVGRLNGDVVDDAVSD